MDIARNEFHAPMLPDAFIILVVISFAHLSAYRARVTNQTPHRISRDGASQPIINSSSQQMREGYSIVMQPSPRERRDTHAAKQGNRQATGA